ncbi:unnamed protein product [Arabidopsis arenosa]|uniref:TIR domain-containing protein n=1 Tax=Arabidopsis arenosa TaxID=38785 RepID=A0A8S1ZSA0_ARAAE|nr:unnamed protein product [Arabidopsis arenosa]
MKNGFPAESLDLYKKFRKKDVEPDKLFECTEKERLVFDGIEYKDVVSWTLMFSCYVGRGSTTIVIVFILTGLCRARGLDIGRDRSMNRLSGDVACMTALALMYVKCAGLECSLRVFDTEARPRLYHSLIECWNQEQTQICNRIQLVVLPLLASMAISLLYLAKFVFVGLRRLLQFLKKSEKPRITQPRIPLSEAEDSPSRSLWKYDVFLSFRGTDVRRSFVSHLYEALNNEGIKTFHDDRELQKGNFIWEGLEKAIDQSRFAILVISEDYATSHWCLEEISALVDLAEKKRLELIPIFYGIDPSDLKRRSGCFNKAFEKHEQRFDLETVDIWRRALAQVGKMSGWNSKSRNEDSELVHEIVQDLSDRLSSHISDGTAELYMDRAKKVLDSFVFKSEPRLVTLMEKSLIGMSKSRRLWVHDLLQDMAKDIICEGKKEKPWKRKMLWNFLDIKGLFTEKMGTKDIQVESILLNMAEGTELCINPATFKRMFNLKFLKIHNNFAVGGSKLCMTDYLVELNLPDSSVETLWSGTKDLRSTIGSLESLRHLGLAYCPNVTVFPVLGNGIETLSLNGTAIEEVPSSIGDKLNLMSLDMSECQRLQNLPHTLSNLKNLKLLYLRGCTNITERPHVAGEMRRLDLYGTSIEKYGFLSEEETLELRNRDIDLVKAFLTLYARKYKKNRNSR